MDQSQPDKIYSLKHKNPFYWHNPVIIIKKNQNQQPKRKKQKGEHHFSQE